MVKQALKQGNICEDPGPLLSQMELCLPTLHAHACLVLLSFLDLGMNQL